MGDTVAGVVLPRGQALRPFGRARYARIAQAREHSVSAYSIIVEYETVEGGEAEFCALMGEHARRTLDDEPGCLRFELLRPIDEDGRPIARRFIVSALYANRSALAAHRRTPGVQRLLTAMEPFVVKRRPTISQTVFPAETDHGLRPEELNAANDG